MPRINGLSEKQKIFVEEYLRDFNGTEAAKRAGYSAASAGAIASENLKKPVITLAIQQAVEERRLANATSDAVAAGNGLSPCEVLRELRILGKSSIWDYAIDDKGQVTLAPGAPMESIRAVSSIKRRVIRKGENVTYESEIKLWDKNAALDKAGKHLGLWRDMPPLEVILGFFPVDLRNEVVRMFQADLSAGSRPQPQLAGPEPAPPVGG